MSQIFSLRKNAREATFIELYLLYKDFFAEQCTFDKRYTFDYSEEVFVENLKNELASGRTAVLLISNKDSIIGFVRGYYKTDGKTFLLQDMYLAPAHRRKGYGTQLFKELRSFLSSRHIEQIDLLVDCNNERGIAFWHKLGFFSRQVKMSLIHQDDTTR